MLSESELIQIRRHLHQIPELALQEHETHAYLAEVVEKLQTDYMEVQTPAELPTALLVLVKGTAPQRMVTGLILMLYPSLKQLAYPLLRSIPE